MAKISKAKRERIERERERARRILEEGIDDPGAIESLSSKELGRLGECVAQCYLQDRGYELLETGYTCPEGEADLIVVDPDTGEVVLVEVKSRRARSDAPFYPEEAVDERKQRRYARIAAHYAMTHVPVLSMRFDVVAVTFCSRSCVGVAHLCGAFEWDSER